MSECRVRAPAGADGERTSSGGSSGGGALPPAAVHGGPGGAAAALPPPPPLQQPPSQAHPQVPWGAPAGPHYAQLLQLQLQLRQPPPAAAARPYVAYFMQRVATS